MTCPDINLKRFVLYTLAMFICLSGVILISFSTNRQVALANAPQDIPQESGCNSCSGGRGGRLFSTGQPIKIRILPSQSDFTSVIALNVGGKVTIIGTDDDAGATICVGPFPVGAELVFSTSSINPPGPTFVTGSGSGNPDGVAHAQVDCLGNRARVGFYDQLAPIPPDAVFDDAVIEVSCCATKCDTINFRSPQYFLNNINHLPQGSVIIGGVNFNAPVSTNNIDSIELALTRGGALFGGGATGSPLQRLNREFVAAQLSLELAGGHSSPTVYNAMWSTLGCPGRFGDFAPFRLSNGVTLSPNSMLKDLFTQTESAIRQNRASDYLALAGFFNDLSCDDASGNLNPFGECPSVLPLPDLVVSVSCEPIATVGDKLVIKVRNVGLSAAPPSKTGVYQGGKLLQLIATKELAVNEEASLVFNIFSNAVCPGSGPCAFSVYANDNGSVAERAYRNNSGATSCH